VDNLINKIPPIILNDEIEKKITLFLQTKTNFFCVVDDKNHFLGIIFLCDLLRAQQQNKPIDYQAILQMVTTVKLDGFLKETIPGNNPADEVIVILNEMDQYYGVAYVREILSYQINQLSKVSNYQHLALTSLHYALNVVNENHEIVHSSPAKQPISLKELMNATPLVPHINNALQNSTFYKEIEFLSDSKKYIANILPNSCNDTSEALITIQDTSKLKHFVILETVFGSMREGINIVDENGYLQYVNPSSARYVNVTSEEMIGQHITNFYPDAVLLKVLANR